MTYAEESRELVLNFEDLRVIGEIRGKMRASV